MEKNEAEKFLQEFFLLANQKKFDECLKMIDKLLKINQSNSDYYNYKGLYLYDKQIYKEALVYFDKALDIKVDHVYYTIKSLTLIELYQYDEAHNTIDFSLKIKDKYSKSYYLKGKIFYKQSNFYKSIETIIK